MKKPAGIKAYTFPFLGSEWTLRAVKLPDEKPGYALAGKSNDVEKTVHINAATPKQLADLILHELVEAAIEARSCCYENAEGKLFIMSHKEYSGIMLDCAEANLSICKQLKL